MPSSKNKTETPVIDESATVADIIRVESKVDDIKKDVGANLDATKELTKTVADLVAAWEKWRKAGKFIYILGLTLSVGVG